MTDAEVIVAGGGPAGAATAARLAGEGVDVLVLDRARFPREKACAEFLSPGAVAALGRLGVLAQAGSAGAWQEGMRIVGRRAEFVLRYEGDRRALGIRRTVLDALLLEQARAAGARVVEGVDVGGVHVDGGRVGGVRLRDGRVVRSRFVVAADGLRSPVARSLGLDRTARWPRRLGLVARVRGAASQPLGLMALGGGGYCGVAAIGSGEVSVGLAVSPDARRPGEGAHDLFARSVAAIPAVRAAVGGAEPTAAIHGIAPLARRVARVEGPGYLLVGDAAGFTDPFTGEGIFRALRGAELATDATLRALARADGVPAGYAQARASAFAAKQRACLLLQAALAAPAAFEHFLGRAARRDRTGRVLAGVFGDYLPAEQALRPRVVADLVLP